MNSATDRKNLVWAAQTILGQRPACSAIVMIADNGRFRTQDEYRLVIKWEDENGASGTIEVEAAEWLAIITEVMAS